MERLGIKIPLLVISLAGAVHWAQPPHEAGAPMLAAVSAVWSLFALGSFRWGKAEDWLYRLSSFLGVSLATVEGASAMLALQSREGLLPIALLHSVAFVLAVVGRYQKVAARRPRRD